MRSTLAAMFLVALVVGCAQSGETRDAAQPQPAKKYRDGPVTPKAMQPVPSSF